jgi:succinoglycan biosynthesis transport protein ExoP
MSPMPEPRDVDTAAPEQPHHMPRLLGATRPLPMPLTAGGDDNAMDPRRIFGALKYHWFLFIVLGSLLGAGLGAAAWELLPAKYTTTALLRVNSSNAGLLGSDPTVARTEFLTFLRTQADAIKSENVLRAAMRDSKIGNTDMLKSNEDPIRWLQDNLLIEFSEHSELMKVSLTGENPGECAEIINAIDAAYMKEVVLVDQLKKTSVLNQLETSRTQMEGKVKNFKVALELKRKRPGGPDAPPTAIDSPSTKARIGSAEFSRMNEDYRRSEMNYKLAEQRLKQIQARRDKIDAQEPTPAEFDEYFSRDGDLRNLTDKAERAAKNAVYIRGIYTNKSNPDVLDAQEKADDARKAVDDYKTAKKLELIRQVQNVNRRALDNEIEKATAELSARDLGRLMLRQQIETTPPPLEPIRTVSNNVTIHEKNPADYDLDESSLMYAITTYEQLLDRQNKQTVEIQASKPRVDEWQKAAVPIKKEMKKQIAGTLFAVLLGFGAVGGCITLYENKVSRLFGSQELAKNPAMNVIGTLPEIGGHDAIGDPQSLKADPYMEGVEKVRLMLGRNFLGKRAQTILISSASPGEGKTTLAGHLAVSMTRADRKTILVDANLRQPSLHLHLGTSAGPGVCEVLRGETQTQDVVQRTAIGNLWFLPGGMWDSAAQQALGRDRFRRILDKLRQEYDYVIIDSHDLSTVADSFQVGQHCDAVIVCARKYVSRKPAVEEAYRKVCDLGVPHTGVIFLGENANA